LSICKKVPFDKGWLSKKVNIQGVVDWTFCETIKVMVFTNTSYLWQKVRQILCWEILSLFFKELGQNGKKRISQMSKKLPFGSGKSFHFYAMFYTLL